MLIPIIKFYKLLKDPSSSDDELIFIGKKSNKSITNKEIIDHYIGAK